MPQHAEPDRPGPPGLLRSMWTRIVRVFGVLLAILDGIEALVFVLLLLAAIVAGVIGLVR